MIRMTMSKEHMGNSALILWVTPHANAARVYGDGFIDKICRQILLFARTLERRGKDPDSHRIHSMIGNRGKHIIKRPGFNVDPLRHVF